MTTDELRTALERIKDLGGPVRMVGQEIVVGDFLTLWFGSDIRFRDTGAMNWHTDCGSQCRWLIIGALMEDLNQRGLGPALRGETRELESDRWYAGSAPGAIDVAMTGGTVARFASIAPTPLEAVMSAYIQALEATQSEP